MSEAPRPYRVGTLSYSRAGLAALFCWLLIGDVMYILIDQIQPRLLPIMIKQAGGSDSAVAIIVGSFAALLNFIVTPVVSYRSDRKRGRWGRRIPYLFWATPFVSLFLALTPFAPAIAAHVFRWPAAARLAGHLPWNPVVLTYAALVFVYQFFEMVVGSIYFYLFSDVVPASHLGRFLTLFRVCGALATFVLNYWLLGLGGLHPAMIFIGIAVVNLVGFMAMCRFVREGEYPPVKQTVTTSAAVTRLAPLRGTMVFFHESFREPIYLWMHALTVTINAPAVMTPFIILFARDELHFDLGLTGRLMSWASFAWIVAAYPFGILLDRWGSMRLLNIALAMLVACCFASFFLVSGPVTFLISSTIIGLGYWMIMLASLKLVYDVYHPERLGQLAAASAMVKAFCIAFILSPLAGWFFDSFQNFRRAARVPLVGPVEFGHYRFAFVYMGLLYLLSIYATVKIQRHWIRHGGPDAYSPPL